MDRKVNQREWDAFRSGNVLFGSNNDEDSLIRRLFADLDAADEEIADLKRRLSIIAQASYMRSMMVKVDTQMIAELRDENARLKGDS